MRTLFFPIEREDYSALVEQDKFITPGRFRFWLITSEYFLDRYGAWIRLPVGPSKLTLSRNIKNAVAETFNSVAFYTWRHAVPTLDVDMQFPFISEVYISSNEDWETILSETGNEEKFKYLVSKLRYSSSANTLPRVMKASLSLYSSVKKVVELKDKLTSKDVSTSTQNYCRTTTGSWKENNAINCCVGILGMNVHLCCEVDEDSGKCVSHCKCYNCEPIKQKVDGEDKVVGCRRVWAYSSTYDAWLSGSSKIDTGSDAYKCMVWLCRYDASFSGNYSTLCQQVTDDNIAWDDFFECSSIQTSETESSGVKSVSLGDVFKTALENVKSAIEAELNEGAFQINLLSDEAERLGGYGLYPDDMHDMDDFIKPFSTSSKLKVMIAKGRLVFHLVYWLLFEQPQIFISGSGSTEKVIPNVIYLFGYTKAFPGGVLFKLIPHSDVSLDESSDDKYQMLKLSGKFWVADYYPTLKGSLLEGGLTRLVSTVFRRLDAIF